ncbi:DUF3558 domain-containing protein [Prauserella flavalba]|uniref:DUF3558 domain-containing protein n=1 Tax=Prauserella flavalba TaxID=1477506 RepID=A0A318LZE8_9PSEU|nr:DUF3558 domain-containing protein [Prauserella flavalba]PXY37819.1 hypothetical protein BA062_04200 [Prauserella flavalba]
MRRWPKIAFVVATAAALAACSGKEPGDASPSTRGSAPSASASSSTSSPADAPEVRNPLNISAFTESPCDTISSAQIEEYFGPGIQPEARPDGPNGPECAWFTESDNVRAGIVVTFPELSSKGLSALYAHRSEYAFFEELDLIADGYPAVAYDGVDSRDQGECAVRVGTSNDATVDINIYLSQRAIGNVDPCEAAEEVATAVIGNIQARS